MHGFRGAFTEGPSFRHFRDKLSQAFASFRGLRFGFGGGSTGHPPLLLCIVRVYGAAQVVLRRARPELQAARQGERGR